MPDIVVDPKEPQAVTSSDGERIYHIRTPKPPDEDKFRAAVAASGAREWGRYQLLGALKEVVATPVEGDGEADIAERQRLAEAIEANVKDLKEAYERWHSERTQEAEDAMLAAWRPSELLLDIERLVLDAGTTRYSRMVEDNAAYHMKAGRAAFRLFGVGWEGVPHEFRRTLTGVPDDVLDRIPSGDRALISLRVHALLKPEDTRLGNSESRSPG
ncbi:MAG: hypothetical protein K0R61_2376 [Microvirga sp.]|nr:hypothetical protein [Microvirga sp.]